MKSIQMKGTYYQFDDGLLSFDPVAKYWGPATVTSKQFAWLKGQERRRVRELTNQVENIVVRSASQAFGLITDYLSVEEKEKAEEILGRPRVSSTGTVWWSMQDIVYHMPDSVDRFRKNGLIE